MAWLQAVASERSERCPLQSFGVWCCDCTVSKVLVPLVRQLAVLRPSEAELPDTLLRLLQERAAAQQQQEEKAPSTPPPRMVLPSASSQRTTRCIRPHAILAKTAKPTQRVRYITLFTHLVLLRARYRRSME